MNKENYNLQEYLEQTYCEHQKITSLYTQNDIIMMLRKKLLKEATEIIINMMKFRNLRCINVYNIEETIEDRDPITIEGTMTLESINYVELHTPCIRLTASDEHNVIIRQFEQLSTELIMEIVRFVNELMESFDNGLYTVDDEGNLIPVEE